MIDTIKRIFGSKEDVDIVCKIMVGSKEYTINFKQTTAHNFDDVLRRTIVLHSDGSSYKPTVRFEVDGKLLEDPYVAFRKAIDHDIWQTTIKPSKLLEKACLVIAERNRAELIVRKGDKEVTVDKLTLLNPKYFVEKRPQY